MHVNHCKQTAYTTTKSAGKQAKVAGWLLCSPAVNGILDIAVTGRVSMARTLPRFKHHPEPEPSLSLFNFDGLALAQAKDRLRHCPAVARKYVWISSGLK